MPDNKLPSVVPIAKANSDDQSFMSNGLDTYEEETVEETEPVQAKPKVLSELEKAVLRRRKAMGDPDEQIDESEYEITVKKAEPSIEKPPANTM